MQSYMRASPVGRRMAVSRGLADVLANEFAEMFPLRLHARFAEKTVSSEAGTGTVQVLPRKSAVGKRSICRRTLG